MKGSTQRSILKFFCTLLLLVFTQAIYAISFLPGSTEPGRVGGDVSPAPAAAPSALPPLAAPKPSTPALGKEATKIKFVLRGIELSGNTIYRDEQIATTYSKFLGKEITVAQLQDIVQGVTNYYRNNGYILSRAILPPQTIKNGVVKIRILEGYIAQVRLAGDAKGAGCHLLRIVNQIKCSRPLNVKVLEHYLLVANAVPGVVVKAVLQPSKTETAASDLELTLTASRFGFFLTHDNYGTRYLGPAEVTTGVSAFSVFRSGDVTSLSGSVTSTTRELNYIELSHDTPICYNGMRLIFGANYTETQPGFTLEPLEVHGRAKAGYIIYKWPIIMTREDNVNLFASLNYLDSSVTTLGFLLYNDHIRTLKLSGTYDFADRFKGANLIALELTQGLPILGQSSPNSFFISRPDGHAVYTRIGLQLVRNQAIYKGFSAFFLAKGQYSFQPLLASEQFGFGGSQLGRGYDPSEILGDHGAAGSVEGRYDWYPNYCLLSHVQAYIYYDIGKIWNRLGIAQPKAISAACTGFGARFNVNKYLSGNVMSTQPLTKPVVSEAQAGNGFRMRTYFSLTVAL